MTKRNCIVFVRNVSCYLSVALSVRKQVKLSLAFYNNKTLVLHYYFLLLARQNCKALARSACVQC